MIRINDDYVISVEPYEYCVKIDKHRQDKKGNDIYDTVGHYTSLESAILGAKNEAIHKSLFNMETTLENALKCVADINAEFKQMLEEAMALNLNQN